MRADDFRIARHHTQNCLAEFPKSRFRGTTQHVTNLMNPELPTIMAIQLPAFPFLILPVLRKNCIRTSVANR